MTHQILKKASFYCKVTINITIEDENWNVTKQVTVKYNETKYEYLFKDIQFKLGIRLENCTIFVGSLYNGTARPVESWQCGEKIRESSTCDDSHLNWTRAYSCGLNNNWCSTLPKDLLWIWESHLISDTSHICCRKITGRLKMGGKYLLLSALLMNCT